MNNIHLMFFQSVSGAQSHSYILKTNKKKKTHANKDKGIFLNVHVHHCDIFPL